MKDRTRLFPLVACATVLFTVALGCGSKDDSKTDGAANSATEAASDDTAVDDAICMIGD